jgi:hypothetical protein
MIKSKTKETLKTVPYHWSFVGGVLFLIIAQPTNVFSLFSILKLLGIFILGIIFVALIIFFYRKMPTLKTQKFFLILLAISSPITIFMMMLGNMLGLAEMFVYGFASILFFLMIISFILVRPEKIKKRILIIISFILFIVAVAIFNKDYCYQKIKHLNCARRGGNFNYTEGYCHFKNKFSIEKNIFGLQINIPEEDEQIATLLTRKGDNLSGDILDLKTNSRINGGVTVYPEKINTLDSIYEFSMPFSVEYNNSNDKYYYLGLFQGDVSNSLEKDYSFYDKISHIDSYFIGKNIELGDTILGKHGLHDGEFYGTISLPVFQEYYENGHENKKEIELRIDQYKQSNFYLYEDCEKTGELITKTRGDGKSYEICVMKSGGICTPEAYKRGVCPMEGFKADEFMLIQDRDNISYNIEAKKYCLAMGRLYVDGTCQVSLQKTCPMEDYYNGKCD